MAYVFVDVLEPTTHKWFLLAIPAKIADRLANKGLFAVPAPEHGVNNYVAIDSDWAGDFWPFQAVIQIDNAFIAQRYH